MSVIKIRFARISDAPKVADLCSQLGHAATQGEIEERLRVVMKDPSQAILVAEVDDEVLGLVNVVAMYELLSGIQGRIWGLVVDDKARGLGLGRRLMEVAEKWVKEKGSSTMKVNSNVKRVDAHKFYEKIGYEKYKEQAIFRKDL